MHTDCGMRGLDAQELRRELEAETGVRPDWEDVPMHTPEDDARTAVERIRSSPFLDPRARCTVWCTRSRPAACASSP